MDPTGKVLAAIPGGTNSAVRLSPEIPADFYDFQRFNETPPACFGLTQIDFPWCDAAQDCLGRFVLITWRHSLT